MAFACMFSFTVILDPVVAFRRRDVAAAYILHALSGTVRQRKTQHPNLCRKLIAIGVLLYAAVGVWCLFKEGTSLNTMH